MTNSERVGAYHALLWRAGERSSLAGQASCCRYDCGTVNLRR